MDCDVMYLKSKDFSECFKYYMKNYFDEQSIDALLKQNLTIKDDGFFIFAIGVPCNVPFETIVEVFFMDSSHKLKRIIIDSENDNELVGLQWEMYFQAHEFAKNILDELQTQGYTDCFADFRPIN